MKHFPHGFQIIAYLHYSVKEKELVLINMSLLLHRIYFVNNLFRQPSVEVGPQIGLVLEAGPPPGMLSSPVFTPCIQLCHPLLLPGEMNILQIQCKIDFNTFLLRKTYRRGMKWLRTMLLVHVDWLLGIPGHRRWFLVLTGNNWWLWMTFGVLFTTLSLNNAIFCVILWYLLLALRFFWLFWYETSLNEFIRWTRISVKGQKNYISKKKTLKLMAEHSYGQGCVSHF